MSKAKARKAARSTKSSSKHNTKSKPPASKNLKRKLPPTPTGPSPKKAKSSKLTPQAIKSTIPFYPSDRILLIGEGDFSYAASLNTSHHCTNIVATSFDTSEAVATKYPHCAAHLSTITATPTNSVYHGIDATSLSKTLPRVARTRKYDRIIFNFPHTGGLSTDVNRQVRHNQELLVKFLKESTKLLSTTSPNSDSHRRRSSAGEDEDSFLSEDDVLDDEGSEDKTYPDTPTSILAKAQSTILVTLFDAEPYTLWNVKDLARHVGLKSITSFAFPWDAYPGYKHARTLGTIEGKGGAWKGEERVARTYVFGLKEEEEEPVASATGANAVEAKRKRGRGRESESEGSGDEG